MKKLSTDAMTMADERGKKSYTEELTTKGFFPIFWDPHHMILAFPLCVAYTLFVVHEASFFVTLSGPQIGRLLYFAGILKLCESPGKAGRVAGYSFRVRQWSIFQILLQYSAMERSEENLPMRLTLRMDIFAQCSVLQNICPTCFWQSA